MPLLLTALLFASALTDTKPPMVGEMAPAFELKMLNMKTVKLKPLLQTGPVVLVVLRGYPGYQCPFCTKQVVELISKQDEFSKRKASVVLVYPGQEMGLEKYADDFISGKDVPKNYAFTIDPGYKFVNSYGLRWDANRETAYPSTFVIGKDGKVVYAKISHEHGDRAPIKDVLAALDKAMM